MQPDKVLIDLFREALAKKTDPEILEVGENVINIYESYCDLSNNPVMEDRPRYEANALQWEKRMRRFIGTGHYFDLL